MKSHMGWTGAMLFLGLALTGAFGQAPTVVHLTYVKAPLNVPSILEKNLGLLEARWAAKGIKVDRVEINSGAKQTEAMAAGSIDIATVLGGTSALLAAANGNDLKIVGIYARAPEAYRILAKAPGIRSIQDLNGKTVAGPKGTVLHQLLLAALGANGLSPGAVRFVNMDIPGAQAALLAGSVDAALLAGASADQVEAAGGRVLATGQGLVNGTIVIAVRGGFLRQHPDLVQDFLAVHRQALARMTTDDASSMALVTSETGLTEKAVRRMLPWYDFDPTVRPSDIDDLKKTQEFLVSAGLLAQKTDVDALVVRLPGENH